MSQYQAEKRKYDEISSDSSEGEEEWIEVGSEGLVSTSLPTSITVQLECAPKLQPNKDAMKSIKDKTLRRMTIQTLFSLIIARFLQLKDKLSALVRNQFDVVLMINFSKLTFKILFRKRGYYAICICMHQKYFCMFCDMDKQSHCRIQNLNAKSVNRIPKDCFLLSANRDFGFMDITDTLPFNHTRVQYLPYFKLMAWLYSSGKKSNSQLKMPTSIQGFRNHPVYCLEKTLAANEVLCIPQGKERSLSVGIFKKSLVYPTDLIERVYSERELSTMGLVVKNMEQPTKISGSRKLFGKWQCCKMERPSLLADGTIPRNEYGSIEILHKNMIPEACKIFSEEYLATCKFLNLDYVRVLAGFMKRIPIYNGIITKIEYEAILQEVHAELKELEREKLQKDREIQVYLRWKKLISGILLKKRLESQYL